MTCKLHINVLDSCNRATGNFYLSAITGLAGGEAVGGHGRPPAHPSDLRGVATPTPSPPSVPNRHIRSVRSLRGMGLDCQISLRCSRASSCLVLKSPQQPDIRWGCWQSGVGRGIGKGEPGVYSCGKVRPFLRKSVMENDQVQPAVLGFLAVSREVARAPSDQLSVASG